jgi:hypothetical protein
LRVTILKDYQISTRSERAMATEQINLRLTGQEATLSPRLLGTLGMIAAPMLFIEGVLYAYGYADGASAWVMSLPGLIYLTGWACSLTGMRRLRATGHGALSKALFIIQLAGLILAFLFNVQEMAGANPDNLFFHITDIAWPASHVLMLVAGVFVLTAKVWRGWRVATPFLCGLALPVFFAASALINRETGGFLFGVLTAVGFMSLGYAVRTAADAR